MRGISWLHARLVYAEALEATGAHERACAVLAEAHTDLLANAEKIGAPAMQRSFLKKIPEHARITQLAVAWSLSPPVLTPVASGAAEDSRALSSLPPSPRSSNHDHRHHAPSRRPHLRLRARGSQNYEADRRAAEAILALVPAYPRWARLNRSFLGYVGSRWAKEGVTQVLDLGSGLPTQGHFNERMPTAKILFADFDPLTVAQGQHLLAYTPDMAFAHVDMRNPDELLEQATSFFGTDQRLAVGLIGIAYLLSDSDIRTLARRLHDFCAPGSVMALSFHHVADGPDADAIRDALFTSAKHARVDYFLRSPEEMAALLAPWRIVATQPLEQWVDEEETLPFAPTTS